MDETKLAILRTSLSPEIVTQGELTGLARTSLRLLEDCGQDTTIDGAPARVTTYSHDFPIGDEVFHVRVAQFAEPNGSRKASEQYIHFIFDETDDPANINTPNAYALQLTRFGSGYSLTADNGVEPIVNDPEFVELVRDALADMNEQHQAHHVPRQKLGTRVLAWAQVPAHKIRDYYSDPSHGTHSNGNYTVTNTNSRGENRRFGHATALTLGLLSYGHLLFGHVDAKIGPVPMPAPVEWMVDWNNSPDHHAQSFAMPEHDLEVNTETRDQRMPLDARYDTSGAPRGKNTMSGGARADMRVEAKPGLYSVSLSDGELQVKKNDTAKNNYYGGYEEKEAKQVVCTNIFGNFALRGDTVVFTQDTDVAKKARVTALNSQTLQICPEDSAKPFNDGTRMFIWHK